MTMARHQSGEQTPKEPLGRSNQKNEQQTICCTPVEKISETGDLARSCL
jgi:hypothetical protein